MPRAASVLNTRSFAAVLLGLAVAACAPAPDVSHDPLAAGADPLRSHFNRDIGHTRIVLLAAPT